MKILKCDDAGWGFPLSGVMVGVSDDIRVETDIVPVEFFKPVVFQSRAYMTEYAKRGLVLIRDIFQATPETHELFICRGWVNECLADGARHLGFKVRRGIITGMLQTEIEKRYRAHILELTGIDLCYDPKGMEKKEIVRLYYRAIKWGALNRKQLKTGWGSLRRYS